AVAVAVAVAVDFDLPLTFGAPPKRRSRWTRPAGRRTWMCGVFREGRMPSRKIPPAPRTRCAAPGAKAGCAFFAPGFFAQAKKGSSRRHGVKAFDVVRLLPAKKRASAARYARPLILPRLRGGRLFGHLLPQAVERVLPRRLTRRREAAPATAARKGSPGRTRSRAGAGCCAVRGFRRLRRWRRCRGCRRARGSR